MHTAEVIAIGSELLGSTRLDTNSLFLAERLASLGIELRSKTVVGDSRSEVAEHLRRALDRADLVILTGGLGPTDDDVTRDALADVLGLPLIEHHDIVERLVQRFARRGFTMPDVNRRQALVIQGGVVLDNPNGTAPGQMVAVGHRLVDPPARPAARAAADDGRAGGGAARGAGRFGAAVSHDALHGRARGIARRGARAADLLEVAAGDAADRDDHPCRARSDRAASRHAIVGCRGGRERASRVPATRSSPCSGRTSSAPTGARWRRLSGSSCSSGSSRSRPPSRAPAGCCCRG